MVSRMACGCVAGQVPVTQFSFLIFSLLLQGQCLGPVSYGLGAPRARMEAEPALSFLSQQALLWNSCIHVRPLLPEEKSNVRNHPYLVNQINSWGSYDYSITHPFFSKYPAEKLSSQLREESLKKPFLSYTLSELQCFLRSWGKAEIECLELRLHYGNLLVSSSSHPQTSSS